MSVKINLVCIALWWAVIVVTIIEFFIRLIVRRRQKSNISVLASLMGYAYDTDGRNGKLHLHQLAACYIRNEEESVRDSMEADPNSDLKMHDRTFWHCLRLHWLPVFPFDFCGYWKTINHSGNKHNSPDPLILFFFDFWSIIPLTRNYLEYTK